MYFSDRLERKISLFMKIKNKIEYITIYYFFNSSPWFHLKIAPCISFIDLFTFLV